MKNRILTHFLAYLAGVLSTLGFAFLLNELDK